ncbi:hypothetical protein ACG04Q_22680 [Roseateles sp. DXS20W]|uniref:Uncharacterized protein n=1 Tax=Pelomonas lactea TaxID=3299030 RepID=A0ABW7GQZ8_9BURK
MRRDAKLFGGLALALGLAGVLAGVSLLVGAGVQPEGSSCKAVCGLAMLATELLGDAAGAWVGGLLWMAVGSACCWVGYRVLKD